MKPSALCISVLIFCSCSNSLPQPNANTQEMDSTTFYFHRVLDSLSLMRENHELAEACREHFEEDRIKFDPRNLSTGFVLDNFQLMSLDSIKVLVVDKDHWSPGIPNLLLHFIDRDNNLVFQDSIEGCKYHNGKLLVEDWNNDGKSELLFRLFEPVSSTFVDYYHFKVYEFDKDLHMIFSLIERERNCGLSVDESFNTEIVRSVKWTNPNQIEIQEKHYRINCESSDRNKETAYEKELSSVSYTMVWDEKKKCFVGL